MWFDHGLLLTVSSKVYNKKQLFPWWQLNATEPWIKQSMKQRIFIEDFFLIVKLFKLLDESLQSWNRKKNMNDRTPISDMSVYKTSQY